MFTITIETYLEMHSGMASATRHVVVGVDDDFRVRESIESLVESAGYTPRVFASAEDFLKSGTLAAATCLITDVRMPGMNGIELQRRIRLERPKLPVIFITAHYDEEARQRALDDGAIGFLCKPFDAVDLLDAIQAALTKAPED
jgi:FixJ family two-component response regulator